MYKSIPLFRTALLDINKDWSLDRIIEYTADVKKWVDENYSQSTRITLFSNLRKQIEKVFTKQSDEYKHMRVLAMTDEERKSRETIAAQRINDKNSNLIILKLVDFKKIALKIYNLPALARDILFCCIFSGARTIEILSNKFKFENSDKKDHIKQIGASKSKHSITIEKPLFTTYKSFMNILKRVRDNVDQSLTNIELNQKYGKMLANIIDTLDIDYITKVHDLRRIYAAIAYYKYGKNIKTQQLYYSEILGHDGTGSAQNYSQFVFKD